MALVQPEMYEDRVMVVPIRIDRTVRIADIPHDLTQREADKIKRMLDALVNEEGVGCQSIDSS